MSKKKFKVKKSKINYDTGPAYSATSKSRSIADKKYNFKASGSGLDSKLYQNPDGSYTRKSVDSSPAEYKKGGKFNPKYTKGSKNVGERKALMSEIAAIYDKHRGTKDKRKKKGFPPAVKKKLQQLMSRRDKL